MQRGLSAIAEHLVFFTLVILMRFSIHTAATTYVVATPIQVVAPRT